MIHLVTISRPHEPPNEYHAFETRASALDWMEENGADTGDLERYTSPTEHESVRVSRGGDYPYAVFSIRDLEVRS